MKIPNFASLYHSGASNFWSDSQSARYGPSRSVLSTLFRTAARGAPYFALAFCQSSSIFAGVSEAVGAVEVWACTPEIVNRTTAAALNLPISGKNAKRQRMISFRGCWSPGTDPKHEALSLKHLARLVSPPGHSSGRACFSGFDSSELPHNNR